MRLLGTVCNGAKGTVLASVGRFVVAAGVDVFGSDRQVTVIDVTRTWVEGEGYRGDGFLLVDKLDVLSCLGVLGEC